MRTLLFFLLLAQSLFAETLYVTQTANNNSGGTGDGLSLGTSWSVSQLNTSGNWATGAGLVSAGDTVSLNGTLTSSISILGSGTVGDLITVLFASGAKFSATTWPSAPSATTGGAIVIFQQSYITVDGGTNGAIECTANGTNLANQVDSKGINATSSSFLTVQNLIIRTMYLRVQGTDVSAGANGIQNTAKNGNSFTDFTVNNCTISDCSTGIATDYVAGCMNYTITNNTVYNCNWGGGCGNRGASDTMTGLVIAGNTFYGWSNWDGTDTTSQSVFHHNGFYAYAEGMSSGGLSSVTAYNNIVGPGWSTVNPNGSTSGLFFSGNKLLGPILIYGNLFIENNGEAGASNGHIFVWPSSGCVTRIYNNTSIGGINSTPAIGYEAGNGGAQTLYAANNICTGKTFFYVTNNASLTATINRNVGYNLSASQQYSYSANSSGSFYNFAAWQVLGFDVNGSSLTPNLDVNYYPVSASSAIGAGSDNSAYYTTDKAGIAWAGGTGWGIGALKAQATVPAASRRTPAALGVGL